MKKQDYSKLSKEELARAGAWAATEMQTNVPYNAEVQSEASRVQEEFKQRGETLLWQKIWRGQ
jgi:hypothetical protein